MRLESPSRLCTVGLVSWGTQDWPTGGSSLLSVPALAERSRMDTAMNDKWGGLPSLQEPCGPSQDKIKAPSSPGTVETTHQGL